jgi:hypothetical protein
MAVLVLSGVAIVAQDMNRLKALMIPNPEH